MMPASEKICGPIDGRLRCDDEGWFPRPKARRRKTATPFTLNSGDLAPLPRGHDRPDVKCGGRQPMRDITGPSFKPRERSRVGDERSISHAQVTVAPSSVWSEGRNGAVAIDEVCVTQRPCSAHAKFAGGGALPSLRTMGGNVEDAKVRSARRCRSVPVGWLSPTSSSSALQSTRF